jgi:hypothetical protein
LNIFTFCQAKIAGIQNSQQKDNVICGMVVSQKFDYNGQGFAAGVELVFRPPGTAAD